MHYVKPTTRELAALIALVVSAVTLGAQGTPTPDLTRFAGTWKEDLSKTVRNVDEGDIRKYELNSDGGTSVTIGAGATAYHDTFRVDGKSYPVTPRPGAMQRWTHPDPATWVSTVTQQGVPSAAVRRTVSRDGTTLKFETTFTANNGAKVIHRTLYKRISAENSGLVGTWKPVSEYVDTPDFLSFQVTPDRTLELAFYTKAKPNEIDILKLSPDGQVINQIDRDPNTNKQTGAMAYRKQP